MVPKFRLKRSFLFKKRTHISHYYFKKHLGTNWLEGKENISFIGITCFSLNQLKLLSMALELMLSVLASSAISLEIILSIDYFKSMRMHITKGYAETFLHLRKWLTKSTRINQSMRLPLRYTLQYWNSEANIANTRWHPGFLVHPI